jgi:predicted double-glycine peptidase
MLLVAAATTAPLRASAAEEVFGNVAGFPNVINVRVQSMREARFVNVVRQQADFSCGAAAIATILRFAYGEDVSEASVLAGMFSVANPDVVRQRGFSMLDMKQYALQIGMQANGYRVNVDALYNLTVPGIALINMGGYQHFVVVKKATPRLVYVADPALGNRRLSGDDFQHQWNHIIFVLAGDNYRSDNPLLNIQPPAPVEAVAAAAFLSQPLPNTALMTTVGIPPANRI